MDSTNHRWKTFEKGQGMHLRYRVCASCVKPGSHEWHCKKRKRNKIIERYRSWVCANSFLSLLFPKQHNCLHNTCIMYYKESGDDLKYRGRYIQVMYDYCVVFSKRLGHPQILISVGGPGPNLPWRERVNSTLPSGNNCSKLSAVRCEAHWYSELLMYWGPDLLRCLQCVQTIPVLTFPKHMATSAKKRGGICRSRSLEELGRGGCPRNVSFLQGSTQRSLSIWFSVVQKVPSSIN